MRGRVKFYNKTKAWGFIVPEEGGKDVFFHCSDLEGAHPIDLGQGLLVEFEDTTDGERRQGKRVRLLPEGRSEAAPVQGGELLDAGAGTRMAAVTSGRWADPGSALTSWAFIPLRTMTAAHGGAIPSILPRLAELALEEDWEFSGPDGAAGSELPILRNYLSYTFYRLQREGKVVDSEAEGGWAAFNTGLVDNMYDPIFALFSRNRNENRQPWSFESFCIPGKAVAGKRLTSVFDPLPEPAKYFSSNFEMLLDTDKEIHVDYDHVIYDGVRRGRFPPRFLRDHCPKGIDWVDYPAQNPHQQGEFLEMLSQGIVNDIQTMRAIKNRIEDAKKLAEKRTRWNYKTAIPQYYPKFDSMSFLLPLAIVDDEKVDISLVVTRNPSGSYQGRTVLPLTWSYQNARLVCRPDSDWLTPRSIGSEDQYGSSEDEG